MTSPGIVVMPGEGRVSSFRPGRSIVLKLQGGATGDSIMLFEEAVPPARRVCSTYITTATRWRTS